MIRQIQQQFWQRFQMDYLRELQAKIKWQKTQKNLEINDMVFIKEPIPSPLAIGKWLKSSTRTQILTVQYSTVRKVDVQTSATKEKTLDADNRLVPLLTEDEENTEE